MVDNSVQGLCLLNEESYLHLSFNTDTCNNHAKGVLDSKQKALEIPQNLIL